METGGLYVDELPSNKLKDKLLQGVKFSDLEKEGALNENLADANSLLTKFNQTVTVNFHQAKRFSCADGDLKCCRDINYYLDLIRALIEFSVSSKDYKEGLVELVKDAWENRFGKHDYNCHRMSDKESVRKRCILKQLYDYCDDKNVISGKEGEYYKYLEEKWNKIIDYTTSANENVHFKIDGWRNNELFDYKEFLLKPEGDCSAEYKKVILSHISLSNGKPTSEISKSGTLPVRISDGNADRGGAQDRGGRGNRGEQQVATSGSRKDSSDHEGSGDRSKTVLGDDKYYHAVDQPEHEEGADETGSPLWETPLNAGFSALGAVFFLFFLYKFSPVGPWISTLIKKNPGAARDIIEDESFLFLNNHEHNNHVIVRTLPKGRHNLEEEKGKIENGLFVVEFNVFFEEVYKYMQGIALFIDQLDKCTCGTKSDPCGKIFKLLRKRGNVLVEHLQRRKSNKAEEIAERGTKLEGKCEP
ncbi:PIR Superfamily Protein [Plasmodium ovale curtisi]|uniref:PIR Superfamily Protein n=1 Tax=Plasmodium ovale curtisi TaxID=864141 RepID=A0A1A8WB46_PLAOA|nr:PIR Superfamily Protein [Plasmodium ovale curtisi]SBT00443.1 PIR Superfamily Protein [Plasmodium ovale curtisi]